MRNLRLWIATFALLFVVGGFAAAATGWGAPVIVVNGTPVMSGTASVSGSCSPEGAMYIRAGGSNGSTWQCAAGTWTQFGSAGAGVTLGGDVTGASGSNTVDAIHGMVTPASSAGAAGNSLRYYNSGELRFQPINLAGLDDVSGVLPRANQQDQTLSGDITGTTGASTVHAMNGTFVSTGVVTGGFLGSGSNRAASGDLRMANNGWATWRNNANSGDVNAIRVTTDDSIRVGDANHDVQASGNPNVVIANVSGAAVTFGRGSSSQSGHVSTYNTITFAGQDIYNSNDPTLYNNGALLLDHPKYCITVGVPTSVVTSGLLALCGFEIGAVH